MSKRVPPPPSVTLTQTHDGNGHANLTDTDDADRRFIEHADVADPRPVGIGRVPAVERLVGIAGLGKLLDADAAQHAVELLGDADAEALFHENLALTRELFPTDIQNARALEGLSSILVRRAQTVQALSLGEEALTIAGHTSVLAPKKNKAATVVSGSA